MNSISNRLSFRSSHYVVFDMCMQARRKQLQIGGAHIKKNIFFYIFFWGGGHICANYWGGGGHGPPVPPYSYGPGMYFDRVINKYV